ncbi:MAG: hypothetical protein P4L82_15580 [Ancalomicrobiaceae bacterium]|nr:hypothetical protein [Ancalomicrobiaceae bacterium]
MAIDLTDLERALISGGDDRIALDATTGLNMYGYAASPRGQDLAFGSSTGSSISLGAFAALQTTWASVAAVGTGEAAYRLYAAGMASARERLVRAVGIVDEADVIFAASGTDVHLIATLIYAGLDARPLTTIAVPSSETGSGVGLATAAKHFSKQLAGGGKAEKGASLTAADRSESISIPVRDAAGFLRPEAQVADDIDREIAAATAAGGRALLIITDVSKTGLIVPGLATALALKEKWGVDLELLVDACQWRLAPETLRAYLARGLAVAVTGSKFLAGPIFSGALLVPRVAASRFKRIELPAAAADYSSRADWPDGWDARNALPERANFGLMLRWQAALTELERFTGLHGLKIAAIKLRFAEGAQARLKRDAAFEPLNSRRIDRSALGLSLNYDVVETIFPFLQRHAGRYLSAEQSAAVYRRLAAEAADHVAVRLGQPVAAGTRDGVKVSALRLCLSAPLVVAAASGTPAVDKLVADAMTALDRTAVAIAEIAEASIAVAAAG